MQPWKCLSFFCSLPEEDRQGVCCIYHENSQDSWSGTFCITNQLYLNLFQAGCKYGVTKLHDWIPKLEKELVAVLWSVSFTCGHYSSNMKAFHFILWNSSESSIVRAHPSQIPAVFSLAAVETDSLGAGLCLLYSSFLPMWICSSCVQPFFCLRAYKLKEASWFGSLWDLEIFCAYPNP